MKKSLRALVFTGAILGMLHSPNAYAFGEENVLNVSPRDYVESVEKKLSDYNMKGVYVKGIHSGLCLTKLGEKAKKNFPNLEVVVNFKYSHSSTATCYGTALIPKK